MGSDGRSWLSPQAYEQVRSELERLLLSHRSGFTPQDGDADADAWARHQWRERRIRYLQEILLDATVGDTPPDDGIAEAGMVLTVRIDDDPETETFLLAGSNMPASADLDVYSPESPIGRALLGAREGDVRSCQLPDGATISITLITAKPFGHEAPAGRPDSASASAQPA